jgi:hypothetical protein
MKEKIRFKKIAKMTVTDHNSAVKTIIEILYKNKMAGKGQTTRARKR